MGVSTLERSRLLAHAFCSAHKLPADALLDALAAVNRQIAEELAQCAPANRTSLERQYDRYWMATQLLSMKQRMALAT